MSVCLIVTIVRKRIKIIHLISQMCWKFYFRQRLPLPCARIEGRASEGLMLCISHSIQPSHQLWWREMGPWHSALPTTPLPVVFIHRHRLSCPLCFNNPETNFIMFISVYFNYWQKPRMPLLPPTLIPNLNLPFRFYFMPFLSTSNLKLMFHYKKFSSVFSEHFLHLLALIKRW